MVISIRPPPAENRIELTIIKINGAASIHLPKWLRLEWLCDAVTTAAKPTTTRRRNQKHDTLIVLVKNCPTI